MLHLRAATSAPRPRWARGGRPRCPRRCAAPSRRALARTLTSASSRRRGLRRATAGTRIRQAWRGPPGSPTPSTSGHARRFGRGRWRRRARIAGRPPRRTGRSPTQLARLPCRLPTTVRGGRGRLRRFSESPSLRAATSAPRPRWARGGRPRCPRRCAAPSRRALARTLTSASSRRRGLRRATAGTRIRQAWRGPPGSPTPSTSGHARRFGRGRWRRRARIAGRPPRRTGRSPTQLARLPYRLPTTVRGGRGRHLGLY